MTLPTHLRHVPSAQRSHVTEPPTKRLKVDAEHASEDKAATFVRRHPLGVRPAGNALTSTLNLRTSSGLFAQLPDELLMRLLETLLPLDLLRVGATCRALHAYTRHDELWRALFVECPPVSFKWRGTWRSTYLAQPVSHEPRVNCSNLFSDELHRPFFCAHVPLAGFAQNIPSANEISRLDDLRPKQFSEEWFKRPFILTAPVKEWPIFRSWSTEQLLEKYNEVTFRAESVDWPLRTYVEYMDNNHDESPLYLFDRAFVENMDLVVSSSPEEGAAYWPPTCFGPDLFSLLGSQRPDHRWLIIGPDRSGSTFHKDPNATSAWNAVLKGSKYWIMFPSSANRPPPPGVYISEDQSEVTSPLSIAEWLLGFHEEARRTPGCREGICKEGEVLYVPSGWFHLVLNLEPSIAITQNLVPRKNLANVLLFLRDQKESISGFANDIDDPYRLLRDRVKEFDQSLLEKAMNEMEILSNSRGGKWELLTKGDDLEEMENNGGFSFGFGGDDEDGSDVP